jgi:hypothetical protein
MCCSIRGSANLFNSRDLVNNLRKAECGLIIDGVQTDSEPVIAYQEGDTVFGKVHYSPDSRGNILSFGTTKDRCHHAKYDFDSDTYMVKMTKGGVVFMRWNNIYIHDTTDPSHTLGSDHLSMQITVRQNAAALCIVVVQHLNMFPPSTSLKAYSPRELMWNRVVDAKTDLALGFEDYVQTHRNVEYNSLEPRTDGPIALYPIENLEGTWA